MCCSSPGFVHLCISRMEFLIRTPGAVPASTGCSAFHCVSLPALPLCAAMRGAASVCSYRQHCRRPLALATRASRTGEEESWDWDCRVEGTVPCRVTGGTLRCYKEIATSRRKSKPRSGSSCGQPGRSVVCSKPAWQLPICSGHCWLSQNSVGRRQKGAGELTAGLVLSESQLRGFKLLGQVAVKEKRLSYAWAPPQH